MTEEDFDSVLKNRDGRGLLVKFGAVWCGPCRRMQPILEELAHEWQDYVDFYAIDVDDDVDAALRYGIRSVPTFIFFDDRGTLRKTLRGMQSKKDLNKMISRYYE